MHMRTDLIRAIEDERGSRVLTYVTVGRPDISGMMDLDAVAPIHEHLQQIGYQERIDLFLKTRGGHTPSAQRIAYLIREYCDEFSVLIPRYSHSAGTTLALAADEIVMHRMGELGPIDPSVSNAFNPPTPGQADEAKVNISVEDVNAYLGLAKDLAEVGDDGAQAVFDRLASSLHPLALGNVHRQYLLIKSMGRRLLLLHMDEAQEKAEIDRILDVLAEKMYYHGYPISRREAKDYVGLKISYPPVGLEDLMWELHLAYDGDLHPDTHVLDPTPGAIAKTTTIEVDSGVIESTHALHVLTQTGKASPSPNNAGLDVTLSPSKWSARPVDRTRVCWRTTTGRSHGYRGKETRENTRRWVCDRTHHLRWQLNRCDPVKRGSRHDRRTEEPHPSGSQLQRP